MLKCAAAPKSIVRVCMKKKPKEALAKGLSLPRDVVFGDFIITLTGNEQVMIENYKGILSYEENQIAVQGNHVVLRIIGTNLVIQYYSMEIMKVTGEITRLEYA